MELYAFGKKIEILLGCMITPNHGKITLLIDSNYVKHHVTPQEGELEAIRKAEELFGSNIEVRTDSGLVPKNDFDKYDFKFRSKI